MGSESILGLYGGGTCLCSNCGGEGEVQIIIKFKEKEELMFHTSSQSIVL